MSTEYREREDDAELTSCDESSVKPLGTQLGGELHDPRLICDLTQAHQPGNVTFAPVLFAFEKSPAAG